MYRKLPGGHFRAEGEAVPLRKKPDILPTLAAFNLRRGGSPAPILDRGILPPPHVPRGLLANIIVHEIGGRVGGGREDLHSNRDGDERRRFVKEIIGGRESV